MSSSRPLVFVRIAEAIHQQKVQHLVAPVQRRPLIVLSARQHDVLADTDWSVVFEGVCGEGHHVIQFNLR